jgi:16S rRNA (uracil1498-N3)-methyltransferase
MRPTHVTIGPEGGLTDAELSAAIAAGWQPVDLGSRILRVETAAVALAALIALR